jgi:hypothetical protein
LIDIPGTASRFIPLKQPGKYPITTGIRQLAQALTEPAGMADARQLRLDSERAFRLARAGCRKFFDELNDLGWDLQLQA